MYFLYTDTHTDTMNRERESVINEIWGSGLQKIREGEKASVELGGGQMGVAMKAICRGRTTKR
jgi:hypothetical protein